MITMFMYDGSLQWQFCVYKLVSNYMYNILKSAKDLTKFWRNTVSSTTTIEVYHQKEQ